MAFKCIAGGKAWLVDLEEGSILATYAAGTSDSDEPPWIPVEFSSDGSFLLTGTNTGRIGLLDVSTLRTGAPREDALAVNFGAHNGALSLMGFSADGSRIASWGPVDGHLRVWRTEDGQLLADLGRLEGSRTPPSFSFHPNGRRLIVEGTAGTLRVFTLDTDELIEIAQSRLTRSFSADECATFRIEPCPTLEDIQQG